jgi:methionyl-tRNA formyltransferase
MPYHGAYIKEDKKLIIIWRAEIINDKPETAIGKIITRKDAMYLSFFDGTLLIKKYEIREINYQDTS